MSSEKDAAQPEQSSQEPAASVPAPASSQATAAATASEAPKPVTEPAAIVIESVDAAAKPAATAKADAMAPEIVIDSQSGAAAAEPKPSWRARVQKDWAPKRWTPKMPSWATASRRAKPESKAEAGASRTGSRFPLLAASLALAACIGAAAGAAGVSGIAQVTARPAPAPQAIAAATPARPDAEIKALRDAVAQLRGQVRSLSEGIAALRSSTEGAGRGTQTQIAKLTDTVDRLEKAQAEPHARLTKMAAAVERLERRDSQAPSPEVTGSIRTTVPSAPPQPPQPPARELKPVRPVVEGWRLHEVQRGVALIEGRVGLAEVMVGDTVRGVGRVEDIRREDGRWVVVTSRGFILPAR